MKESAQKPRVGKHEFIDMALQLKAEERYEIVEKILQSMDKPDADIDRIWAEEALHRARACDEGLMKTVSSEIDTEFAGRARTTGEKRGAAYARCHRGHAGRATTWTTWWTVRCG